jgi:hypothetical protein
MTAPFTFFSSGISYGISYGGAQVTAGAGPRLGARVVSVEVVGRGCGRGV